MDIETLNQRLADVDAAISNVMKGGQIIQTRNGKGKSRVRNHRVRKSRIR